MAMGNTAMSGRPASPRSKATTPLQLANAYAALANDTLDPFLGRGGAEAEMKEAHKTCDLARYLAIEKRTMKT